MDSPKLRTMEMPQQQQQRRRVAIIGGSASGMPTARWALEYGWEPVVFERDSAIGGLWLYKETETDMATVMKCTVINTAKEMTAYSDFPPPAELPTYMHNRDMLKYLRDYAQHHSLEKYYRFGHRVVDIRRSGDYELSGRWTVDFVDSLVFPFLAEFFRNGNEQTEIFEAVAVCSGHHRKPNIPKEFLGQSKFRGRITHSHSYRHNAQFEGKTVVIVGIGNSAIDMACDIQRVAKKVYLSTRSGAWLVPKLTADGYPFDMWANRRLMHSLASVLPKSLMVGYMESKLRFISNDGSAEPKHRVTGSNAAVSDELWSRIVHGHIVIRPNISHFTETGIVFEDGSVAENVDEVIWATGYLIDFPYLESGKLLPVEENRIRMYKNILPFVDAANRPPKDTLGFIGLIQPRGSLIPPAELSARFFFANLCGQLRLPSVREREAEVERKLTEMSRRYIKSIRNTIQVDTVRYMTELGDMLGCTPQPWKYALSNPRLALKLLFGPDTAYGYRLAGPHKWDGAAKAVLGVEERRPRGFCPEGRPPLLLDPKLHIAVFGILLSLIISYLFARC